MENNILNDLKTKEREMYNQLQSSILFKQWEGIRSTIQLYEQANGTSVMDIQTEDNIPTEYSSDLTWGNKVLFALKRIHEGIPEEITKEIMKFETELDEKTVFHHVRGKTYQLLQDKKVRIVRKIGRKSKLALR